MLVAGMLMVGLGVSLGVIAARYRDTWIDHTIRFFTIVGVSAPGFVWAVILMLLFAYFLPLFPVAGRLSDQIDVPLITGFLTLDSLIAGKLSGFTDALWHLILPAFALSLSGIGQACRLVRANMVETYNKPYIEMAKAYGFSERRIAGKFAFRPSMIPSLTIIGLDFAAMLGNAFLVESVFAWPGLSKYGVAVILQKDLNGIVGTVLVIAAMFVIMNIIVDLFVLVLNPRVRLSGRAS
jgi:peptide/nickel transport system permease protein